MGLIFSQLAMHRLVSALHDVRSRQGRSWQWAAADTLLGVLQCLWFGYAKFAGCVVLKGRRRQGHSMFSVPETECRTGRSIQRGRRKGNPCFFVDTKIGLCCRLRRSASFSLGRSFVVFANRSGRSQFDGGWRQRHSLLSIAKSILLGSSGGRRQFGLSRKTMGAAHSLWRK
jgi:hypothetical protein